MDKQSRKLDVPIQDHGVVWRNAVILSAPGIRGEKTGKSMEDVRKSSRNDSSVEKKVLPISRGYVYSGLVGNTY